MNRITNTMLIRIKVVVELNVTSNYYQQLELRHVYNTNDFESTMDHRLNSPEWEKLKVKIFV